MTMSSRQDPSRAPSCHRKDRGTPGEPSSVYLPVLRNADGPGQEAGSVRQSPTTSLIYVTCLAQWEFLVYAQPLPALGKISSLSFQAKARSAFQILGS